MTREEFKNYEGHKTFGFDGKFCLEGGVVVGYSPNDEDECPIYLRLPNKIGHVICMFEVEIPNEKELDAFRKRNFDKDYSYLWCSIDNVKI